MRQPMKSNLDGADFPRGRKPHTQTPSRIATGHVDCYGSLGNLKNATLPACGRTMHTFLTTIHTGRTFP